MPCAHIAGLLYIYGFFVCTILAHQTNQANVYWTYFNQSQSPIFEGKLFIEEGKVVVEPPLQAASNKGVSICGFTLYDINDVLTKTQERHLPILLSIRDPSGVGEIMVKPNALITEPEYNFQIEAYDCSQPVNRSPKASIHLKVHGSQKSDMDLANQEANKKGPLVWSQAVYNVRISEETTVGDSIIQVIARHNMQSSNNTASISNLICDYSIIAPRDTPFDVDGQGIVRLKTLLNAAEHRNYVLRIEAKDCDFPKPSSAVVSVNVEVYHICQIGWQSLPEQINYVPGSGVRHFAQEATLDLCINKSKQQEICHVQNVIATISLHRYEPESSCDHDVLALRHMRKMCNAEANTIELLPSPEKFIQQAMGNVSTLRGVPTTPYIFDGVQTRWEVPSNIVSEDHSLGDEFSFSFWMKHVTPTNPDAKEQILCNSDSATKNRHHYAVFIHHCKLIVLLRREAQSSGNVNDPSYRPMAPSEWRFQLLRGEICDGKWHHYAISRVVNTELSYGSDSLAIGEPQLRLLVDGRFFFSDMLDNPQVIDDWEMQPLSSVDINNGVPTIPSTRLSIGACWHGAQQQFTQYFKGELAGLSLLRGHRESDSVFHCINQCQEKLDFHAMNDMSAGMSVSLNSDLSLLMVNGHNVTEVARLVEKVGYVNSRLAPTPGKRQIKITTEVRCRESAHPQFYVPNKEITILVLGNQHKYNKLASVPRIGQIYLMVQQPVITIKDSMYLSDGISILETLSIKSLKQTSLLSMKENKAGSSSENELLASCLVRVEPQLSFPYEYIHWPRNKYHQLPLNALPYVSNSSYGLLLEGEFSASQYMEWLKEVRYIRCPQAWLDERYGNGVKSSQKFYITCSQRNGDAISEEMAIVVNFPSPNEEEPESRIIQHDAIHLPENSISYEDIASHGKDALLKVQPHYLSKASSSKVSKNGSSVSSNRGSYLFGGLLIGLVVLVLIAFALIRHNQQRTSVCNFAWLSVWKGGQHHKIHPGIEVVSLPANVDVFTGVENNSCEADRCNSNVYPGAGCQKLNDPPAVNLKVNPMEEIAAKMGLKSRFSTPSGKLGNGNRNAGSYRQSEDDADSLLEGIPPQGMDTLDNYCGSSEDECGDQCLPKTHEAQSPSHVGLKPSPTVLSAGHSFIDSLTASQWSTGSGGKQLQSMGRGFNESIRRKWAQLTTTSPNNPMTTSAPAGSCFMQSPSMEWDDSDIKEQLSTHA